MSAGHALPDRCHNRRTARSGIGRRAPQTRPWTRPRARPQARPAPRPRTTRTRPVRVLAVQARWTGGPSG